LSDFGKFLVDFGRFR